MLAITNSRRLKSCTVKHSAPKCIGQSNSPTSLHSFNEYGKIIAIAWPIGAAGAQVPYKHKVTSSNLVSATMKHQPLRQQACRRGFSMQYTNAAFAVCRQKARREPCLKQARKPSPYAHPNAKFAQLAFGRPKVKASNSVSEAKLDATHRNKLAPKPQIQAPSRHHCSKARKFFPRLFQARP